MALVVVLSGAARRDVGRALLFRGVKGVWVAIFMASSTREERAATAARVLFLDNCDFSVAATGAVDSSFGRRLEAGVAGSGVEFRLEDRASLVGARAFALLPAAFCAGVTRLFCDVWRDVSVSGVSMAGGASNNECCGDEGASVLAAFFRVLLEVAAGKASGKPAGRVVLESDADEASGRDVAARVSGAARLSKDLGRTSLAGGDVADDVARADDVTRAVRERSEEADAGAVNDAEEAAAAAGAMRAFISFNSSQWFHQNE